MVAKKSFKSFIVAPATTALIATGAHAGGLSDAITEAPVVEVMPDETPSGSAGWIVPVLAILLIGVAVASNGDDDDEADEDTDPGPITTTFSSF